MCRLEYEVFSCVGLRSAWFEVGSPGCLSTFFGCLSRSGLIVGSSVVVWGSAYMCLGLNVESSLAAV